MTRELLTAIIVIVICLTGLVLYLLLRGLERDSVSEHLAEAERDEADRAALPYLQRCVRVWRTDDPCAHLLPAGYGVAARYPALCGAAPPGNAEWWFGTEVTAAMDACVPCEVEAIARDEEEKPQRGEGAADA